MFEIGTPSSAIDLAVSLDDLLADTNSRLHPYRAEWPSVRSVVQDRDRLVGAVQLDYRAGQVTTVGGTDIIELTPGSSGAAWSPALVGRTIRIFDDRPNQSYTILDWIDETHLRIGHTFDAVGNDWTGLYEGGSGTYDYVISGNRNRVWYSTVTDLGVDTESVNLSNYFDVLMSGDEIEALGLVGEYLMIFGRKSVYWTTQQPYTDDSGFAAYTQPKLIPGAPGIAAWRSLVQLPGGRALYVGEGGVIVETNGMECSIHPISKNVKGYLRGQALSTDVDVNKSYSQISQIEQLHGIYYPESKIVIYVGINGSSGTPPPYDMDEGPEGALIDDAATLGQEYDRVLVIDFNQSVPIAYLANGHRYPSLTRVAVPTTAAEERGARVFAGDYLGYIYEIGVEDAYSAGGPTSTVRYTASGTHGATTVQVSGTLPTTGDGLAGIDLWLIKADGSTLQVRPIISNTATTITVGSNWTSNPVNGDQIWIAPLTWGIGFREFRFTHPAVLCGLEIDYSFENTLTTPTSYPESFRVDIYTAGKDAAGRPRTVVNWAAPVWTKTFSQSSILFPPGMLHFREIASRAIGLQLFGTVPPGAAFKIGGFRAKFLIDPNEEGKP